MSVSEDNQIIAACEVRDNITRTRKNVREFNNKLTDGKLGESTLLPCNSCSHHIKTEAGELGKEANRLRNLFNDSNNYPFVKCNCHTKSNGCRENLCDKISFNWKNVRMCMSETRKAMRAYSDRVDDSRYKGEDIRPCQTCKSGLVDECKGLEDEIKKIQSNLPEDVDIDSECCSCFYCPVKMRPDGLRGRQVIDQSDSGYISTGSKVLPMSSEGIESVDEAAKSFQQLSTEEETGQSDTTNENGIMFINRDDEALSPKGQYLTLDVGSMTGYGVQEEDSSMA